MKLGRRALVGSVILILPGIILICAILSRQQQLKREVDTSPTAFAKHNEETIKQWKTYSYVPLNLTNDVKGQILALITSQTNHNLLSTLQQDMLVDEFIDFFRAYSVGTWDAYSNFRFPNSVAWHWRTHITYSDWPPYSAEKELDRYFRQGPIFGSDAMQTNFFKHYGADYKAHKLTRAAPVGMDARFKEYVFQYSDCSFYSNFLTAVNFDKSRIVLNQSKAIPKPVQFTAFYPAQQQKCATMPRTFPNLGYLDGVKDGACLLEFDHSIENIAIDNGGVLMADAFFFVDTSPPDVPFPIIVRFYWSPADGRWLPDDLIIGTLETLVLRYPIF